jgi:putative ABC transport system substrate-binding protein
VGRDVSIDDRSLVTSYDDLAAGAARLARDKVSVILAYGGTAVQAAYRAAPTIPIVMVAAGDPVSLGVAASLSRPGGNVTGFTTIGQELAGKRLELLTQIVPSMRRFAVVLYPGSASEADSLRNYEALAGSLQLEARPVEIRTPAEIEPAIIGIAQMKVQAIVVVGSSMFAAHRDRVVAAIAKLRIPAIYSNVSLGEAGGLVAFAPDTQENFYRAAIYVDKILKGAKPADLAIEQPSKWQLIVNLKTAKTLGMTFPQSILLRADRVIE